MADSDDFVALSRVIERSTSLNELQARGLVRLLLKQAGLNAKDVSAQQLSVVGSTLLHESLQRNGVADVQAVVSQWLEACTARVAGAQNTGLMHVSNTVEEVFARMGLRSKL
jgi:hypothetical protein